MNAKLQLVDDEYFDEEFENDPREEPAGGFIALGFEKQRVVIFSRLQKAIFKLKPSDMKEANLRMCLGSDWYDFQSEATDKGLPPSSRNRKKGNLSGAMAKMVIEACQSIGHYQPTAERSTGVWPDGQGGLLINGHQLWRHDGIEFEHGPLGKHVYSIGKQLGYAPETPAASAAEVTRLLESLRSYNWQSSFGSELLLGWVGTSIVASALRRRPHILVTGTRGSGKSTLLQQVSSLLGPNSAPMTGSPTMVGLQQHVQDFPARAVVIDEFESDGRSVNRKGVFEAARASYSLQEGDAGLVRGSPTGEAKCYRMSSPFLGGGISVGPMEPADISRWVLLELGKFAESEFKPASPMASEEFHELGPRLAKLFVSRWDVLRSSLDVFSTAVMASGGDARAGDTFGTLLACFWTFVSEQGATAEDAARMVQDAGIATRVKSQDVYDEQECLSALLTRVVAFEMVDGTEKLSIAEACRLVMDGGAVGRDVAHRLSQLGMRLRLSKATGRWELWVANSENHAELRRLFSGSKWSKGGWGLVLRRLPGGRETTQRLGRGLLPCKVTAFELPAELNTTTATPVA